MPKLLKPSPLQLLDSVSLCIVQFISPVVTHCLTRCLCPCRCFGGWTRSWHRGSISPQSTGSSLTLSTPRSASHALHHPYPCHDANCNSGVTLQCRSTAQPRPSFGHCAYAAAILTSHFTSNSHLQEHPLMPHCLNAALLAHTCLLLLPRQLHLQS